MALHQRPFLFFLVSTIVVAMNFPHDVAGFDLVGLGSTMCVEKLIPCKDHVKSASPPATCCDPLKEIISKDAECLCKVFNDPDSLKTLGITKDDALGLAKSCGANRDVSVCTTTGLSTNTTTTSAAASTSAVASTNTTSVSPPASSSGNSTGAGATSSPDRAITSVSITLSVAFLAVFCC